MGGVRTAHYGLVYILCFGCMNTDKLKYFSIGSGLGYICKIFRPLWILRKGTATRTIRLRIYALESSTDGLKHALRLVPISRLQPCEKQGMCCACDQRYSQEACQLLLTEGRMHRLLHSNTA